MPRHGGSMGKTRPLTDFSELAEELYARPVAPQKPKHDSLLPKWELEALAQVGSSQRDPSERPVLFMPTMSELMHKWDDEIFNGVQRHKHGPFARELGLA